jgi:hypothetical protein
MNSAALGHLDHPARAFDAAAGGATRAIGLLRVRCSGLDGQPVARFGYLIVSLGAAATISHRTSQSRWLKKLGEIAYLLMMPPVTLGYRHRDVAITIDGVAHGTRRLFTAMVANTENGGGGMKLMPGAKPDDGILDLIEMGDVSRLGGRDPGRSRRRDGGPPAARGLGVAARFSGRYGDVRPSYFFAAQPRSTNAVSRFMGKKLSMRSSCRVMSCGVPSVAIVVKSCRETSPLRKCMGSTGPAAAAPVAAAFRRGRTPS